VGRILLDEERVEIDVGEEEGILAALDDEALE